MKLLSLLSLLLLSSLSAVDLKHDFTDGPGAWNGKTADNVLIHAMTQHKPGSYLADAAPVPVKEREVVSFTAEIRIPEKLQQGVYRLQAVALDQAGGLIRTYTSTQSYSHAPEWSQLALTFRVPPKATQLRLRLLHNGVGDVYIRKIACYTPAPGSFEAGYAPEYAGTLEEKKILYDWSLNTGGSAPPRASLDYGDKPSSERYSVNFHWGSPANSEGTVESAVEDSRPAPKSLREIKSIGLQLKVTHRKDKQTLRIRLDERLSGFGSYKNHHYADLPLDGGDAWRTILLTPADFKAVPGRWGNPRWQNIDNIMFNLAIAGKGELNFKISGLTIHYADGTSARPFSAWQDPYWYFPKSEPYPMLPALRHTNVHGSGIYYFETEKGRNNFLELQKYIPNLSFQQYTCLPELLRARDYLRAHNMTAAYQGAGPFLWQKAVELDALSVETDSYELLNERHHKMDYTSPAWREIWEHTAARFGQYGLPEYQTIDSNFRVEAEKVDRNAPAILNGEDHGIPFHDGRTLKFWDYFEDYTGFRWRPEELGYQSWAEHKVTPANLYTRAGAAPQTVKRGYLDTMIRHYAYIRFHSDAGAAFRKHGVRYLVMNNGDDWRNGNDWIYNVRSAGMGGFVEETYFYHPDTVLKAYHLSRAMRKVYGALDRHHRLIAELGKGGHGPIYWAPEYSYAALFDICASKPYDSMEMDWPSASMEDQLVPANRYDYDRFCDYMAKCLAYNHATLGETVTPDEHLGHVFSLQETRTLYAGPRHRLLAPAAEKENFPISRLTPQLFDKEEQAKAKFVVNDCYALPAGMAQTLLAWVKSGPGRILVLHGAAAGRRIDGTMWSEVFGWDQVAMNAPEQFAELFGRLTFAGGRTLTEKPGKIIFKDADGPALSFYDCGNSSGVYFYHHTPGLDPARDGRIAGHLLKKHNIQPTAESGGELYVRAYRHADNLLSYTLFDRPGLDNYKWVYSADDNGLYPWRNPGTTRKGVIRIPAGRYTMFGMLSGKVQPVAVGSDNRLLVTLENITADVLHFVPEGNVLRLKELENRRADLFRFLSRRIQE